MEEEEKAAAATGSTTATSITTSLFISNPLIAVKLVIWTHVGVYV